MNLLAVVCDPLRPYLEQMIPHSPHNITLAELDAPLPESGFDAILLLGGARSIPDNGLCVSLPLVIPRVHNDIALLLGSAQAYHHLFEKFAGRLCWIASGAQQAIFTTPKQDCAVVCGLIDTELGLSDPTIHTVRMMQENEWDAFFQACDLSLLSRLLMGEWETQDVLYVPAKAHVHLTYQRDLIAFA